MHPEDIKAALRKMDSSQSAIARRILGRSGKPVTAGAVSSVIWGRTRSKRIAKEISEVTGIPVTVLFPGRYKEAVGIGKPKPKACRRAAHSRAQAYMARRKRHIGFA